MIDGDTAVNNTPSATVNSEWYLEYSRDIRKTKTLINHVLIASHANQYRSGTQKWGTLKLCWVFLHPCDGYKIDWRHCELTQYHLFSLYLPFLVPVVVTRWKEQQVEYLATYGWLKRIVTIFSPHLMDLSYLILKETTANNRTVRTQHILEKSS